MNKPAVQPGNRKEADPEMKRTLSLILCAAMLLGCLPVLAEQTQTAVTHALEKKESPLYTQSGLSEATLTLHFADGADDLPFVDMTEFVWLLNSALADDEPVYTGEYHEELSTYFIEYTPLDSDVMVDFEDADRLRQPERYQRADR